MKTIVINGGTKGVARKIISACLEKKYNVVFSGRNEVYGKELEKTFSSESCLFVKIENSEIKSLENLFNVAINKFGKVDGYIHYAGITPVASLIDCDEITYDSIFDVNLKSAFFCTQYALKYMIKNGGGSIVYFGSSHMDYGHEDRAPYAISKGALYTLSNHIAHHYAKYKIRSNYVVMGWTNTEGEIQLRQKQGISEQELHEMASKIIPMGRMLTIDDPVPTVMHLLSEDAFMITGSIIRITGGEFI